MKITKKVTIQKPVEAVWKVLAEDFDRADVWMSAVPRSYAASLEGGADDAPVAARVCELTDRGKDGLFAEEVITNYSDATHEFTMVIEAQNGAIPIVRNNATVSVRPAGEGSSEVVFIAEPELKPVGYLLYPVLRAGLGSAFARLLDELKVFVETGVPHPRKQAKLAAAAA